MAMFTKSKAGNEGTGGGNARLGVEGAEFPILCEGCLGDNPYVRMMKDHGAGACKMCTKPYTIFRWRPGSHQPFKKTEVCQSCARIKNLCQCCLLDLKYGLPSQLRDAIMDAQTTSVVAPQSAGQEQYYNAQQLALLDAGALPEGPDLVETVRAQALNRGGNHRIRHIDGLGKKAKKTRDGDDTSSSNRGEKKRKLDDTAAIAASAPAALLPAPAALASAEAKAAVPSAFKAFVAVPVVAPSATPTMARTEGGKAPDARDPPPPPPPPPGGPPDYAHRPFKQGLVPALE